MCVHLTPDMHHSPHAFVLVMSMQIDKTKRWTDSCCHSTLCECNCPRALTMLTHPTAIRNVSPLEGMHVNVSFLWERSRECVCFCVIGGAREQDSTRFAKTQKLLEEYDPDYTPPVPKLPPPGRSTPVIRQTPGLGKASGTPTATPQPGADPDIQGLARDKGGGGCGVLARCERSLCSWAGTRWGTLD